MAKNPGKRFEDDIKKSCQRDGIFVDRVRDNASSYIDVDDIDSMYSKEHPYDFHIYKYPNLMCVELKHTKYTSLSRQRDKTDKNKMIKLHQIEALTNASKFEGVIAGFIFNFYNEDANTEATYFMDINKFNNFLNQENKKSINIIDIAKYGCIKIEQIKLRTHYHYRVGDIFDKYANCK